MKAAADFASHSATTIPCTFAIAFFAAGLVTVPSLATALEYQRQAISAGEWWRLLTGHLTHWNTDHATWDILAFFALGAICEGTWPRQFLAGLAASTTAIAVAIWLFAPDIVSYRGLSGIDTALFTLATCGYLADAFARRRPFLAIALGLLLAGLAAKILYETLTGATLFVDSSNVFVPLPLAHLVGGAVGLATVVIARTADKMRHYASAPRNCATAMRSNPSAR